MNNPSNILMVYTQYKAKTITLLEECAQWLNDTETVWNEICEVKTDIRYYTRIQALNERIQTLRDNKFKLVVVGEFSSGKSYFINVLLNLMKPVEISPNSGNYKAKGLLPDRVSPTTSAITILSFGEVMGASIYFYDGTKRTEINIDDLQKYIAEESFAKKNSYNMSATQSDKKLNSIKHDVRIKKVEVTCTSGWLQNGVQIVDTPGTGSIMREHAEVTAQYIPSADAILFLFTAQPPINNSTKLFLAQCSFHVDNFFFIQTRKDDLYKVIDNTAYPRKDYNETLEYQSIIQNAAIIQEVMSYQPRIYSISSKWKACEQLKLNTPNNAVSGFAELIPVLEEFLVKNRGAIVLNDHLKRAIHESSLIIDKLNVLHGQSTFTLKEIESNIVTQERQIQIIDKQLSSLCTFIDSKISVIIEKVIRSTKDTSNVLYHEIRQALQKKKPADLKRDGSKLISLHLQCEVNNNIRTISKNVIYPLFRELRVTIKCECSKLQSEFTALEGINTVFAPIFNTLGEVALFHIALPTMNDVNTQVNSKISETFNILYNKYINNILKMKIFDAITNLFISNDNLIENIMINIKEIIDDVSKQIEESYRIYLERKKLSIIGDINKIIDETKNTCHGTLITFLEKIKLNEERTRAQVDILTKAKVKGEEIIKDCQKLLDELSDIQKESK